MIINHNMNAMNAHRLMTGNTASAGKSMEKLSSGLRINRAGDDAAGLAISEKMRGQIRGLDQASRNAQDSISMLQTAEGALNETHSILQRMRELSVQSANDTATDTDRGQMNKEVVQLKAEINRIAENTEFNTKKLLNGSLSAAKSATGTNATTSKFAVDNIDATAASLKAGDVVLAKDAIAKVDGSAYKVTGGLELSEKTVIKDGVNEAFNITINGSAFTDVTIADGTYNTRGDFAKAVQDAINTKITTNASNLDKVAVTVTNDNKLQISSAETGRKMSITLATPTTNTNGDARAAMGMDAVDRKTQVLNTIDVSAGITFTTDTQDKFDLVVGATSASIDLGFASTATVTSTQIKDTMQTKLDAAYGTGNLVVGLKDDKYITITTSSSFHASALSIDADVADSKDAGAKILGGTAATSATTGVANTTTAGTSSLMGRTAGSVISSGANDQLSLSVDGGSATVLTLTAGNYATKSDLVNEINNQINSSSLVGKVRATLDTDNKVKFESSTKGADSAVSVTAPTTAARSALGELGLAGTAGNIDGTIDVDDGIDLTTATTRKATVVLGGKTAIIDLGEETALGINTNAGATNDKSSRDAIVKALQAQLDDKFGANAITVDTVVSGATETLKLVSNAGATDVQIKDVGGTQTLAATLFGANKTATVGPNLVNTTTAGAAEVTQTLATTSKLADLVDKDGNSLGIASGNVVKLSGTQNGSGFNSSLTITANTTVGDLLNNLRNVSALDGATVALDATNGTISITGATGSTKDLSNMKLSAQKSSTDSSTVSGFNKMFGNIAVTQQAQDAISDSSLASHIGANQGQTMNIDINEMSTKSLKLDAIDVSSQTGAESAITVINNALESVSDERSKLGAFQNRLEHTIANLGTSSENLTSSESRIRDVDMAKEMMNFSKNNILSQAAQAMLAQANQQPQGVLQLLR